MTGSLIMSAKNDNLFKGRKKFCNTSERSRLDMHI